MGRLFVPEQVDIEVRGEDVLKEGAIDLGGPTIVHWRASLLDVTFGSAPVIESGEEPTNEEAKAFCGFDLQTFVGSYAGAFESSGQLGAQWLHDDPFPWHESEGGVWTPKSALPQVRWESILVTPRYLYYKAHYCDEGNLNDWVEGELDGARAHVRFDLRFE